MYTVYTLTARISHDAKPEGSMYPTSIYIWPPKYLDGDYFKAKVYLFVYMDP